MQGILVLVVFVVMSCQSNPAFLFLPPRSIMQQLFVSLTFPSFLEAGKMHGQEGVFFFVLCHSDHVCFKDICFQRTACPLKLFHSAASHHGVCLIYVCMLSHIFQSIATCQT